MMKPKFNGNAMEFNLSKWGYKDYVAECAYRFDKREGKYLLSMWLRRTELEDRMRLSSKNVDTQYISGDMETIVENICRVVHQMASVENEDGIKYFDKYVEWYEYEIACFERGNELFEKEKLSVLDDDKK